MEKTDKTLDYVLGISKIFGKTVSAGRLNADFLNSADYDVFGKATIFAPYPVFADEHQFMYDRLKLTFINVLERDGQVCVMPVEILNVAVERDDPNFEAAMENAEVLGNTIAFENFVENDEYNSEKPFAMGQFLLNQVRDSATYAFGRYKTDAEGDKVYIHPEHLYEQSDIVPVSLAGVREASHIMFAGAGRTGNNELTLVFFVPWAAEDVESNRYDLRTMGFIPVLELNPNLVAPIYGDALADLLDLYLDENKAAEEQGVEADAGDDGARPSEVVQPAPVVTEAPENVPEPEPEPEVGATPNPFLNG